MLTAIPVVLMEKVPMLVTVSLVPVPTVASVVVLETELSGQTCWRWSGLYWANPWEDDLGEQRTCRVRDVGALAR